MTIEDSRFKKFHIFLQHILFIHSGTSFSQLSRKNEEVSSPDGTSPTKHDVWSVTASYTLRTHLKVLLSINLIILVVILLLDGEDFLVPEEDVFVPILGMPLEETFALVHRISFKAGVRSVPLSREVLSCLDLPWWGTTWLGRYAQLSGNDLLFPERISANPLPYRFDSGLIPHPFQAFWTSPVLNPSDFLTMFNCWIEEHLRNFQLF